MHVESRNVVFAAYFAWVGACANSKPFAMPLPPPLEPLPPPPVECEVRVFVGGASAEVLSCAGNVCAGELRNVAYAAFGWDFGSLRVRL